MSENVISPLHSIDECEDVQLLIEVDSEDSGNFVLYDGRRGIRNVS